MTIFFLLNLFAIKPSEPFFSFPLFLLSSFSPFLFSLFLLSPFFYALPLFSLFPLFLLSLHSLLSTSHLPLTPLASFDASLSPTHSVSTREFMRKKKKETKRKNEDENKVEAEIDCVWEMT